MRETVSDRSHTPGIGLLLVVAVAALVAACGGGDGGREPVTISIVVPEGTQQAIEAGESIELMPTRLEFHVGDTLHIRNDDIVTHSIGPYSVAAGADFRFTYGAPGVYEGYCPLSEGDRYEIVVVS